MNKLVLNFICKNESHVILTMLESVKGITDMIVANDTGSTDGTQDLIRKFGEDNNIPTFVVDRPFDNFMNSRNYAMQTAIENATQLGWDLSKSWGYWIDCDETLIVDAKFKKSDLVLDLYMINAFIGQMKYTRNTIFKLSKKFSWYGPVHEFITNIDTDINGGVLNTLSVDVKMIGASWQGDVADKYKKHAALLEDYIDNKDRNSRWVFYTAQSYHDSASIPNNKEENSERLRRALKYYKERVSRTDGYEEERYYSQLRAGSIMLMLEYPWMETHQELLKAFSMDPLRGESIKIIIDYYFSMAEWNLAYLYTKFAKTTFHGKCPYPTRLLFVDEHIYIWKFLEAHAAASFYTGRKDEAIANYNELLEMSIKSPQYFTQADLEKINFNKQFFK